MPRPMMIIPKSTAARRVVTESEPAIAASILSAAWGIASAPRRPTNAYLIIICLYMKAYLIILF